jgi:hypothetical protein
MNPKEAIVRLKKAHKSLLAAQFQLNQVAWDLPKDEFGDALIKEAEEINKILDSIEKKYREDFGKRPNYGNIADHVLYADVK